MTRFVGKCSWFGGPNDDGVKPDEGLAFITELDEAPQLFLPQQPPDTTGLARRLDPSKHYIACRWDYAQTPPEELLQLRVLVRSLKTGREFIAEPADWGPNEATGRVADLSPGLMTALGIETDDEVEVSIPVATEAAAMTVVISAGHGLKIRGASGFLDEVNEARRVVPAVAERLRENGCVVFEFYDDTSTTQQQNLETIVNFHNSKARNLDVSVHFNANKTTSAPVGTEVCYVTQSQLAEQIASAIAESSGLTDRGAKYRSGLYFLNKTTAPAVLIEVCFVDSSTDAKLYQDHFELICTAIADTIKPVAKAVATQQT